MNQIQFETWDLPILYPLIAIYKILDAINFPFPLGFAIIILTILVRFILYPLISSQIRTSKKMQDINPHLSRIKEIHKGDTKMLQQETMRLYREHGVNPAAGCLPVLIQLPLIFVLYSVLIDVVKSPSLVIPKINSAIQPDFLKLTSALDQSFFGLPLGLSPSALLSTIGPVVFLVPVLTGVFQFIQSKMIFPPVPKTAGVIEKKDGSSKDDSFASVFQSQSTYIFPIMIAVFSFTLPVGLSLYWNTFTIFGIIQQYKITGPGGIQNWLDKIYGLKEKKEF